jgi:chromosomal replication initiation ATPase DnaA
LLSADWKRIETMMRTETDLSGTRDAAGAAAALGREQVWLVQATVSHVMGVPLKELCAATRRRPQAAFARQAAIYLCHIVFEVGISDLARIFGRDPSTVLYAVRRIEEMRDDGETDRLLQMLEALLLKAWGEI